MLAHHLTCHPLTLPTKDSAHDARRTRRLLLYCVIIDYAILLFWFFIFMNFHERLYRLHRRWFDLTPVRFDATHYLLMGAFKISFFVFHLAPLIALYLMGTA